MSRGFRKVSCGSCRSGLASIEVFFPAQISLIVQTTATRHTYFSPLFLCFFNLEFRNLLLSVFSVLSCVFFCSLSCPSFYSFLLFVLFPALFSPSVYSLFFWHPLLFSFEICYPFFSLFLLLYSVCFSLMFYY